MKLHETPATTLIEQHYERIGANKGWNRERVFRLCRMLHCTPYELGALVCLPRGSMTTFLSNDHFPAHIALHFILIEAWFVETALGEEKREPVMPLDLLLQEGRAA